MKPYYIHSWLNDAVSSSEGILPNDRLTDVERSGAICFELQETLRKTSMTKLNVAERDVKLVLLEQKRVFRWFTDKVQFKLVHRVVLEYK